MRVLLAVDSSGASQYVIAEAVSRPWPSGTVFCVQSVLDVLDYEAKPALAEVEELKHEAKSLVMGATGELSRAGHEVVSEIEMGIPKEAITQYAEQWRADLIMVGFHRSGAVSRFLLGSVARSVLRAAPCGVEIVRPGPRGRPPSSAGMKILVGTDGFDCSEKAVRSVADRPWPAETTVKVISVREPVVPESASAISFAPLYPVDLMEEVLAREGSRADNALSCARQILSSANLKLCDSVVLFGDPRDILLDEAKSWGADLVVLGSNGRHGLDRLFLGSVSESVAMHAHCSVEVIRGLTGERAAEKTTNSIEFSTR
jgi:nucleotide-binding universal stress UspA family protein